MLKPSEEWKRIVITTKPLTIGRLLDSDIVLNHPAVSKNQAQLYTKVLFSGILFELEDAAKVFSWFTTSRWSVEALGSIADMNSLVFLMEWRLKMGMM